jgi:hypothetical protein
MVRNEEGCRPGGTFFRLQTVELSDLSFFEQLKLVAAASVYIGWVDRAPRPPTLNPKPPAIKTGSSQRFEPCPCGRPCVVRLYLGMMSGGGQFICSCGQPSASGHHWHRVRNVWPIVLFCIQPTPSNSFQSLVPMPRSWCSLYPMRMRLCWSVLRHRC